MQVDSYRTAYAGMFPANYLARFTYEEQEQDWRDLLETGAHVLLVAEDETGAIAGYALGRCENVGLPPFDGELAALHVRRERQRQGIGRELAGSLAAALRAAGSTSLYLWVLEENPARGFYERLGGQLVGRQTIEVAENATAVEVAYGWPDISELVGA